MSLEIYSILLAIGSATIFLVLVLALCVWFFIPRAQILLNRISYETYIGAIAIITIASICFSLIYQLVYLTPVCELCWWQRIFLYPVSVVTLVALWCKTRETHVTVAILALLGLYVACYHYYYHFQGYVLGRTLSIPCSFGGLLPACTNSPILVFGFITIPFMGMMVFGSLLMLSGFTYAVYRRETNTRNT